MSIKTDERIGNNLLFYAILALFLVGVWRGWPWWIEALLLLFASAGLLRMRQLAAIKRVGKQTKIWKER
jgi:hypothetical protein